MGLRCCFSRVLLQQKIRTHLFNWVFQHSKNKKNLGCLEIFF
nr:MAG TPA: hypothetical protein [Caudoviricetes sp.]